MKRTVKVGFFVALLWIIFTLTAYNLGYSYACFVPGMFVNVFLLLCAIALGLFLHKKDSGFDRKPFPDDFKAAMQSGGIYVLMIACFVYLYHEVIDDSIKTRLASERLEALKTQVPDEAAYQKLQENDVTWEDKSYDTYIENQEDQIFYAYSSFTVFIFHLMGLMFFALFYAFFATLILRKIVLRQ